MVDDKDAEPREGHSMNEPVRSAASEHAAGAPPLREPITADQRHVALKRVLGVVSGSTGGRRPAV